MTSKWNIGLVEGIADAFSKAVTEFCEHDKLRYTWMRFLPQLKGYPWDCIWKDLVQMITSKTKDVPVMVPFNGGPLRLIRKSRRFSDHDLDKSGDPLLEDIRPPIYLSKDYRESDLNMLTQCGLSYINISQRLARIQADLSRSKSKIKSSTTDEDWQNRLARALLICWEENSDDEQEEIKQLELLPVAGEWLSAASTVPRLHFPTLNGINIPDRLGLHLLDADALACADRRKLFTALGATELSAKEVKRLIKKRHNSTASLNDLEIVSHVEFLYMTHEPEITSSAYSYIYLVMENYEPLCRVGSVDIYLLDSQPYGAAELIGQDSKDKRGDPMIKFLSSRLDRSPLCGSAKGHSLSWVEFLHSSLGIRRRLRLTAQSSRGAAVKLSPAFQYVLKNRRDKLVGLLEYCWVDERDAIMGSEDAITTLKDTKVPCMNATTKLRRTILPLPKLQHLCGQYTDIKSLPFLELDSSLEDNDLSNWMFLNEAFDVTVDDNVYFYRQVLIKMSYTEPSDDKVFGLLEKIYTRWKDSSDKRGDRRRLRYGIPTSSMGQLLNLLWC